MERTICNLCQETENLELFTVPDLLLDRQDVQATFVQCPSCGLIYQNPRPTMEDMPHHYPLEYDSYNLDPNSTHASWLRRLVTQYGLNKRIRIITREKKQGRLLDVGCATGQFLMEMRQNPGWELFGVETNPHAAQVANEKNGLTVFNGFLENAKYPNLFFDAITLWDVLEHLHDPTASLEEIHRILKPDGILVARVPNKGGWDSKLFGKHWFGWDVPRHLFIFNQRTLTRLLEKNSFEIQRIHGGLGGYNTIVLSLRFWLTAREINIRTRQRIEKILDHPYSRLLTAPFFFFLSTGSIGPFLIVSASKRRSP